jgi:hypothetical protein
MPENPEMYCLGCYYDLRGLPSHRCPECSRRFNPHDPATFSRLAYPTPVRDFVGRIGKAIEEAFVPAETTEDRIKTLQAVATSFANRIRWLEQSNDILRMYLDLVLNVLIERKVLDEAELTKLQEAIRKAGQDVALLANQNSPDVKPTKAP